MTLLAGRDSAWTNDDGDSLGGWVEIGQEEWRAIVDGAGGLEVLTVFSTLTDPDGCYGQPQIYTAWGHRDDDAPLIDIRDYKADDGTTERRTLRKFVRLTLAQSELPERAALSAAHDLALDLDRSVCLRDVIEVLRSHRDEESTYGCMNQDQARRFAADFIEREFGDEA